MKALLLFLIFISQSLIVFAQQKELKHHDRRFSHEIERSLKSGTMSKSSAAYYYTYIGDYKKALETYELPLAWGLDSLSKQDSLDFLSYQILPAKSYLAEVTKDEQLVIISEAHQKPQHRIFTTELLELMYANGYRYLGLETLTPSFVDSSQWLMDTLLNQRGYPLATPLTGTYTIEPQMGNLVRKAIEIGFEIFSYERATQSLERDLQQAINIEKFIRQHPREKILIHSGWYHAIESTFPKRGKDNYMAYHLKMRTGIDPFTIYQDVLSEKAILPESPFYKMIASDSVAVLINEKGELFNGVGEQKHFDAFVYHPRTRYIKKRPNWLEQQADRQFVVVEKARIRAVDYPVIVEALISEEDEKTVPLDVIELKNSEDPTELLLPKGNYTIRLTNKNRVSQVYKTEVKQVEESRFPNSLLYFCLSGLFVGLIFFVFLLKRKQITAS